MNQMMLYFKGEDYMNDNITKYIMNHYGVVDTNVLRKLYNKEFMKIVSKIRDCCIPVKTAFGSVGINLHRLYQDVDANYFRLFIDYIIEKVVFSSGMDITDIISSKDIGLIVLKDVNNPTGRKYNKLYINIDKDIASWIFNKKTDDFLLDFAQGCGAMEIPTGLCVRFLERYLENFGSYEHISNLLGNSESLYDNLYESLKDYGDGKDKYYLSDKYNDYTMLYVNNKSNFYINIATIGSIISNFGLSDSELKEAIKKNSLGLNDIRADLGNMDINVEKMRHIKSDNNELSDDDLCKAVKDILDIKRNTLDSVKDTKALCKKLNIQHKTLLCRLVNDLDIEVSAILGVAERNKYKLGYFYYKYNSINEIEQNEFSSKAFLRRMISKQLN
jgi:hypothetical protein